MLYPEYKYYKEFDYFGSHTVELNGQSGTVFRLWAPNAKEVRIVGNFNKWIGSNHIMHHADREGCFSIFIPNVKLGELYKYEIITKNNLRLYKSDPFAFYSEYKPYFASVVADTNDYNWKDEDWINSKSFSNIDKGLNIYELHLGSWRRKNDNSFLNYREIADLLLPYILEMGYTHIEPLPLMEHPNDASWGYQLTGYYSITSRYGSINDFKYFVDQFHQNGIGIILDWVPGHFCKDEHGLYKFDGTNLYEYNDPRLGEKNEWGTANFDLGKTEVKNFLISNAMFWMEIYHIDGFRIDAVANMLYLNYGARRNLGIKNINGGIENIEAVEFIKELNGIILENFPKTIIVAEEPTVWQNSTKSIEEGGLGFSYKWNMGFISDITKYMGMNPELKKENHNLITFSLMYAFSEKYILSLSHDEVSIHDSSMLNKMFGTYEEKYSGLRLLYGYIMAHPGKKLQFMGCEFGQIKKWDYDSQLNWELLNIPIQSKLKSYVKDLNNIYKEESALWELDYTNDGFSWIDCDNSRGSTVTFIRKGKNKNNFIIIACNFSQKYCENFKIILPKLPEYCSCNYKEIINSNSDKYGGENITNSNRIKIIREKSKLGECYINIKLMPLSISFIKPDVI